MFEFRQGAIPRRVLKTDNRINLKVHAIFIQIRSIVSETKHADRRVHYEFNMPREWRIVKACPLVTVTDVQKYHNIFIFMVEESQNNPEDKNIRQHYCGTLKSRNICVCVCVCVCIKLGIKDIITTSAQIYWRKGLSLAMHSCPVASDVILMMTAVTPFSCGPQLSSPPARKGTIKTTSPRCRGHLTAPATAIVTGNIQIQFTHPCTHQYAEYSKRRRGRI